MQWLLDGIKEINYKPFLVSFFYATGVNLFLLGAVVLLSVAGLPIPLADWGVLAGGIIAAVGLLIHCIAIGFVPRVYGEHPADPQVKRKLNWRFFRKMFFSPKCLLTSNFYTTSLIILPIWVIANAVTHGSLQVGATTTFYIVLDLAAVFVMPIVTWFCKSFNTRVMDKKVNSHAALEDKNGVLNVAAVPDLHAEQLNAEPASYSPYPQTQLCQQRPPLGPQPSAAPTVIVNINNQNNQKRRLSWSSSSSTRVFRHPHHRSQSFGGAPPPYQQDSEAPSAPLFPADNSEAVAHSPTLSGNGFKCS